jgi:hypothetical protein
VKLVPNNRVSGRRPLEDVDARRRAGQLLKSYKLPSVFTELIKLLLQSRFIDDLGAQKAFGVDVQNLVFPFHNQTPWLIEIADSDDRSIEGVMRMYSCNH